MHTSDSFGTRRRAKRTAAWGLPTAALALLSPCLAAQQASAPVQRYEIVRVQPPLAWVGVSIELRESLRAGATPSAPVMVITDVHPGSPAAAAGLLAGDTVVQLNSEPAGAAALARMQSSLGPGTTVRFTLRRGARLETVAVRAATRPPDSVLTNVPRQFRIRIDSAQATLRATAPGTPPGPSEAGRVAPPAPGDPTRILTLRASSDTLFLRQVGPGDAPFPLGAPLDRITIWAEPSPSLPAPSPIEIILDRSSAQASSRASLEAARGEAEEALRRAQVTLAATRAIAPPGDPQARPLAPYMLGQDWVAGARLTPLNPSLGEYFGVDRGLLVVETAAGTPAEEAGIVAGDVILLAGNRGVTVVEELRAALSAGPGSPPLPPLTLLRKGRRLQVTLPR